MADLKINQNLYLTERNIPLSAMMGNLRLIAYGETANFSSAAKAWNERPFDGQIIIYDSSYIEADSSNFLHTKKDAMYFFMIRFRVANGEFNQAYLKIDGTYFDSGHDFPTEVGGSGLPAHTSFHFDGAYLNNDSTIKTVIYKQNAGTATKMQIYFFVLAEAEEEHGLPSEYQEIEYLESNGNQYIDTKVKLQAVYGFDIKFYAKSPIASSGYGCIFGGRTSSGTCDYQLTTYNQYNSGTLRWGNSGDSGALAARMSQNTVLTCSVKNMIFTRCNGEVATITATDGSAGGYCYLFALSDNGTKGQSGSGCRIYYMKIYDNRNQTIRNYIPCRRKSDSVLGMYDTVTKKFFTNNGSGTFTAGPNVN